MGKKKPQKTKELSVAIAEASVTGDETQQAQPQTPRKRGRPRKIIEKPESQDKQEEAEDTSNETQSKKVKTGEQDQQQLKGEGSSASMGVTNKEEDQSEKREVLLPKEPPRTSRARRKSKPRKSS
ncbi:FK506-binding protein 4-like [Fagus crenata]